MGKLICKKQFKVGKYICNDCGNEFEQIDGEGSVCCPDCGSFEVELQYETEI